MERVCATWQVIEFSWYVDYQTLVSLLRGNKITFCPPPHAQISPIHTETRLRRLFVHSAYLLSKIPLVSLSVINLGYFENSAIDQRSCCCCLYIAYGKSTSDTTLLWADPCLCVFFLWCMQFYIKKRCKNVRVKTSGYSCIWMLRV